VWEFSRVENANKRPILCESWLELGARIEPRVTRKGFRFLLLERSSSDFASRKKKKGGGKRLKNRVARS